MEAKLGYLPKLETHISSKEESNKMYNIQDKNSCSSM